MHCAKGDFPHALVSDIAIFVLKRDVKLQLTNFPHAQYAVWYEFHNGPTEKCSLIDISS